MKNKITATTKLFGVIGTPIRHSGSPAIQNCGFEANGIDAVYVAFDIDEPQVKDFIKSVRLLEIGGFNVTMPNKTETAKYMDELSPASQLIGAVNTVVNRDGHLYGHITDGEGFVANLADHGEDVKDKKVTLFGAGGAATAILVQLALDGAKSVDVFNPKDAFYTKAEGLIPRIQEMAPDCEITLHDINDNDAKVASINACDILVNGTFLGMKPREDMSVVEDTSLFRPEMVVADVVYNPRETKLLREAAAAGCKTIPGIGMLLWQGVKSFKLFTGTDMPVDIVKEKFFAE